MQGVIDLMQVANTVGFGLIGGFIVVGIFMEIDERRRRKREEFRRKMWPIMKARMLIKRDQRDRSHPK